MKFLAIGILNNDLIFMMITFGFLFYGLENREKGDRTTFPSPPAAHVCSIIHLVIFDGGKRIEKCL